MDACPLGIHASLHVWVPAEGRRIRTIYLERSAKNYTDCEKTLLSLLRPQLIRCTRTPSAVCRLASNVALDAK